MSSQLPGIRFWRRKLRFIYDDVVVGVHDDHFWPSRMNSSISSVSKFTLGNDARSVRALDNRSLTVTRPGTSTDSRRTITSLFKLRRLLAADSLSRRYSSSGMSFNVKVVAMSFSLQRFQNGGWSRNSTGSCDVRKAIDIGMMRFVVLPACRRKLSL